MNPNQQGGYYPSYEQYTGTYDNSGNMGNNGNYPQTGQQQQQQQQQGGSNNPTASMFYSPPMQQGSANMNYPQPTNYSPQYNNNNISNQPQQGFNNDPSQFITQFSSNPLTQAGLSYGLNYGQTLFSGGKQYVDTNFGKYISFSTLKSYFNVNTSYVFNKIKLVVFPFAQKAWKRRIHRHGDVDSYLPPRDDINAPDLYIPLMAFITYFLLYGFQLGMETRFTPDVLGASITKGIIFWIFELLLFRLGFFFTNSDAIYLYDMVSYTGYKYVLLVGKAILTILVGSYITFMVRCYFAAAIGYFILKTLRLVFSTSNQINSDIQYQQHQSSTDKRSYFVVFFAIVQGILMFLA
ncbi:hypothetical protein DLAC_04646 [Tieghemostelium lacteum]|uniref:Protein YIF1 n=1 Tax=Tieghemostelium lacteum TaxID=361077 RepID=A0A151ZKD6_TIELA|nr:hypothetical protein DLAC_04646 [Tieghemostelium lacteum]|eukprot:KYQ94350.1 hypothetical protein DLAC_04646 [Tieghemostelium lacteum]